jgi:DNA-binding NtrC family response regulator
MLKVLIVDDQDAVRTALRVMFEVNGLPVIDTDEPDDALHLIATEDIGVVIQDMNYGQEHTSGEQGVALFRAIHQLDPDLPVLLMTAWASLETAVQLTKDGASDYIAKPWDDEKLLRNVQNLLRLRELHQENTRLLSQQARARASLASSFDLCGLVYRSAAMHQVVSLAAHVAPSDAPVLVSGPAGSGKEKLAEIVQGNSRRKGKPFVRVNAGGLPDDLLEAELFGAEAGAFTGAQKLRIGRFEAAHGGTLFLDEIGNLSLSGQARLLRVLQTGEFERLGSSSTRKVDVRIISATNADLQKAIAQGRFREDLYFRLNVIELKLPPLAERPDDILPLAEHVLASFPTNGEPFRIADDARAALCLYEWPGNVRELHNRMQRASLICSHGVVRAQDLGLDLGLDNAAQPGAHAEPSTRKGDSDRPGAASGAHDPERATVEEALLRASGVVSKAAAELGMSRQALYRRMERLGIVLERRPKL